MSSPSSREPVPAELIDELKYVVSDVGLCFAFFGIQIALFIGPAVVLTQEGRVWVLAFSIVAVFFCSSVQAAGSLTDWWFQILGKGGANDLNGTLAIIEGLVDTSFHISYLLGDALVVWRAWVIWPDNCTARGLLATCMVFTVAGLFADLYLDFSAILVSKALNAPMIIATLLRNAVATVLVGIRAWEYRQGIASVLGRSTFGSQVGRILVLLLESGLFYCAIWVCIFALDVGIGPVALGASIITSRKLHQLATAYPTFVILILTSQQFTKNTTISLLASMQFESGRQDFRTTEARESINMSALQRETATAQVQLDT
ncbi:hypothetical protein K523DRAFT_419467 [Schizophyllum commune Tattone D]|nr:hypothetical protein K523DRAFT_419467 [Schizophyllum commune Tattone D]